MRFVRIALLVITVGYVAGLTGFLFVHELAPSPHWSIELLREFLVYGFLPLPALLIFGLVLHSRATLALLAVPTIAFVGLFGDLFVPTVGATSTGQEIVVRSHNIAPHNRDVWSEITAARRDRPDLLVLQEIDEVFASDLATQLADLYPYRALHPRPDDRGYGVLSRHPLTADRCVLPLPESRCWQQVTVELNGRSLTLVNVHLLNPEWDIDRPRRANLFGVSYDVSRRERELLAAVDWLAALPRPLIVAGDFNAAPHSQTYRALAARLQDAHAAAGFGLGHTWPSRTIGDVWPVPQLLRIDYIFVSRELHPVRLEVGEPGGSDHHPIIAWLSPAG